MCGILEKESKRYVVVAGGLDIDRDANDHFSQCEYLEVIHGDTLSLSEWQACASFGGAGVHVEINTTGRMVTDPKTGDILAIGKTQF